ncbi:MAG: hypothetical protein F6K47_31895, partial [Symploca sp. SIO2E6]|nr:hypothetical protein [Symploca sp. SIO2E6]
MAETTETELIALRVHNGQYLCAEGGGGQSVVADRDKIDIWETFTLHQLGDSKVAIQAHNGQYVCAEGGGGQAVVANRDQIGPWETFTLHQLGDGKVAIQAHNGQYVCAEGGGGQSVVANRDQIGPWENFIYQTLAQSVTPHSESLLTFDGKDDYISIPLNEPETEVTHEFWFKTDSPNCGFFSVVIDNNWGYHDRHLYLSDGNIKTRIWTNEIISSSNLNLADNKWHHLAHVFGSSVGGQKIYIDGELVASGSKHTSDAKKQDTIWIGYSRDAQKRYCQGQITEVRIWQIARSPEQIKQSMNHRLKGDEEGLLGYWPLNEGSGATATDKTSNGNQGTIYGGGTWRKKGGGKWEQQELDFLTPTPSEEQSPETTSAGESEHSKKTEEVGKLVTQGPKGSSIKGTSFDIQPRKDVSQSKITSIRVWHAWAIDNIEVKIQSGNSSYDFRCKPLSKKSGEEFNLETGDYLTKISGTWGRQAPGYPKEEIITLQFHTHKGITSKVFGGGSGKQEVESFSLEAPEGQEIIGIFGIHGGRQDLLTSLGIYLKPVEESALVTPKEERTHSNSALTFNGTSDYISVPDSASIQISAYTVEVWMKPSGQLNEAWGGIVGKPGRNYNIWLHKDGFIHHRFHTKKSTNAGAPNTPNGSLKSDQWSHVAITNDGKVAKTYINGKLIKKGPTGGT